MLTNVSEIPNLCECFSNGDFGTLVAEVGGRNLGGEEELVTGELGVEKTLGRRSLVAVGDGGVDLVRLRFSICVFLRPWHLGSVRLRGCLCDLRGGSRPLQQSGRPPQRHRMAWEKACVSCWSVPSRSEGRSVTYVCQTPKPRIGIE